MPESASDSESSPLEAASVRLEYAAASSGGSACPSQPERPASMRLTAARTGSSFLFRFIIDLRLSCDRPCGDGFVICLYPYTVHASAKKSILCDHIFFARQLGHSSPAATQQPRFYSVIVTLKKDNKKPPISTKQAV